MPTSTDPINPYQPPKADLEIAGPTATPTSIEDAIAGRYDFDIGDVMDEAWKLTKGFKGSFWGAAIVIGIISLIGSGVVGGLLGALAALVGVRVNGLVSAIFNGLAAALLTPLTMGLTMMAVRRAQGQPASFSTAFGYISKAGPAIAAGLLTVLLTYLGIALLIIPGIYLAVAYKMAEPLIGELPISGWKAMETSRKAIRHKWFRVFGLFIVVGLLTALSGLVLIPLIWTVPWSIMTMGVLYRRIFHATPAEAAAPAVAAAAAPGATS
jgi:hypothetical protein